MPPAEHYISTSGPQRYLNRVGENVHARRMACLESSPCMIIFDIRLPDYRFNDLSGSAAPV